MVKKFLGNITTPACCHPSLPKDSSPFWRSVAKWESFTRQKGIISTIFHKKNIFYCRLDKYFIFLHYESK